MPVPSLPDLSNIDPNDSRQIVDTLSKIKKEIEWLIQHLDGTNIIANSITADHIQAGSIKTQHIAAEGLDAGVIKTGYLSADRIRGGTLQLGGYDNQNGMAYVLDNDGALILYIDNSGITIVNQEDGRPAIRVGYDGFASNIGLKIMELYGGGLAGSYSDPIYVRSPLYHDYQPRTSGMENGYCGVGGVGNGGTTPQAGVGVNFKMAKTYTPSSVYLYTISSNTNAIVSDITRYGFWLYVNGDGTTAYKYWRGEYWA